MDQYIDPTCFALLGRRLPIQLVVLILSAVVLVTMILDQIIDELPSLTRQELKDLSVRVKALLSLSGSDNSHEADGRNNVDNIVLEAIHQFLMRHGMSQGLARLQQSHSYPAFCDKVPGLMKYLDAASSDLIVKRAILAQGLSLLHDNLQGLGVAVSGATLMTHIHRLPACLNSAFPGYHEAGMLSMIVKTSVKGPDNG